MVERKIELKRRYHRKEKMRKLKTKLAAAKNDADRDKILGGKQPAQELGEKRAEIREIISSELLQEIILK